MVVLWVFGLKNSPSVGSVPCQGSSIPIGRLGRKMTTWILSLFLVTYEGGISLDMFESLLETFL